MLRRLCTLRARHKLLSDGDIDGALENLVRGGTKAIPQLWKDKVTNFFVSEEVSLVVPHLNGTILVLDGKRVQRNKKSELIPGDQVKCLQFMNMTLTKAFELWPYSQRSFEGLKPVWVRSANPNMRSRCCCRTHVEAQMKIDGLLREVKRQKLEWNGSKTIGDLLHLTYCDNPMYRILHFTPLAVSCAIVEVTDFSCMVQ